MTKYDKVNHGRVSHEMIRNAWKGLTRHDRRTLLRWEAESALDTLCESKKIVSDCTAASKFRMDGRLTTLTSSPSTNICDIQ